MAQAATATKRKYLIALIGFNCCFAKMAYASEAQIENLMFPDCRVQSLQTIYKDSNKRARKFKKRVGKILFLHAMSAAELRVSKHEACFNVFQRECRISSGFTPKILTNERDI
jgi:hypothetical protein